MVSEAGDSGKGFRRYNSYFCQTENFTRPFDVTGGSDPSARADINRFFDSFALKNP